MRKNEISKSSNNDLITEYVQTYATLVLNMNTDRGVIQASKHCTDLETELLKRGILTKENIELLNK